MLKLIKLLDCVASLAMTFVVKSGHCEKPATKQSMPFLIAHNPYLRQIALPPLGRWDGLFKKSLLPPSRNDKSSASSSVLAMNCS